MMQWSFQFLLMLEVVDGRYIRVWYAVVSWFDRYEIAPKVRILKLMIRHDVALEIWCRVGHFSLDFYVVWRGLLISILKNYDHPLSFMILVH